MVIIVIIAISKEVEGLETIDDASEVLKESTAILNLYLIIKVMTMTISSSCASLDACQDLRAY